MRASERFFENAGLSYNPKTETETEGRTRGAYALADAESWASENGYTFHWAHDDMDSSEWIADDEDGGKDNEPWPTWCCIMRDPEGVPVQSIGGVDFGRDGEPWGNSYMRVVEAELALEGRS